MEEPNNKKQRIEENDNENTTEVSNKPSRIEQLRSWLKCINCSKQRQITPCYNCTNEHLVCNRCYNIELMKTMGKVRPTCMICKNDLNKTNTTINRIIPIITENLTLPCKNEDRGCNYKSTNNNLLYHEENHCIFKEATCPNNNVINYGDEQPQCMMFHNKSTNIIGILIIGRTTGQILEEFALELPPPPTGIETTTVFFEYWQPRILLSTELLPIVPIVILYKVSDTRWMIYSYAYACDSVIKGHRITLEITPTWTKENTDEVNTTFTYEGELSSFKDSLHEIIKSGRYMEIEDKHLQHPARGDLNLKTELTFQPILDKPTPICKTSPICNTKMTQLHNNVFTDNIMIKKNEKPSVFNKSTRTTFELYETTSAFSGTNTNPKSSYQQKSSTTN